MPAAVSGEQHRHVSVPRESAMSHWPYGVAKKIHEWPALSGVNAVSIKQGQPMSGKSNRRRIPSFAVLAGLFA